LPIIFRMPKTKSKTTGQNAKKPTERVSLDDGRSPDFRGKRNDSGYIHLIAESIAAIRGKSVREIAEMTTVNARRLFNIK
ncbi:MAG: hypothetical protein HGA22_11495, partial [Clostridiales bacterium]|nr:hypothetical protein [Clostridiales bacterium]